AQPGGHRQRALGAPAPGTAAAVPPDPGDAPPRPHASRNRRSPGPAPENHPAAPPQTYPARGLAMNDAAQATAGPPASAVSSLRRQAAAIKHAWARGSEPDACAALRQHPDLLGDKSLVLDLAYEEYCLRHEAGRPPDPEVFCDRFPAYRT